MKETKRNIAMLLCSLMAGGCLLSACGSADQPSAGTEGGTASTAASTEAVTEAVTESYLEQLPAGDYDGYKFRVLNNLSNFAYTNFGAEGQTGEALDDRIFERNNKVKDRLNIDIVVEDMEWEPNKKALETSVLAGEDAYDIYFNEVYMQAKHATSGYLHNLADMKNIDLSRPWWNRSAIDSLTIGEDLFFLYGDLHLMFYECIFPVAFNKTILNDYDLEDPYQLVADNRWTLDTMSKYMKAVSKDVNGDGQFTIADQYGLTVFPHNAIGFVIAAGASVIDRDENNLPYWNGLNTELETVYTSVSEKLFSDPTAFVTTNVKGYDQLDKELHSLFERGQVLFYVEPLGSLKKFRNVDFEVGVIPMPKFDEAQEEYRSNVFYGAASLAVPKTNTDLDRTGTILENLCAYSYDMVRPTYFNETLDFKYIQDEEGQKMLDIILGNAYAELGSVYEWSSYARDLSNRLVEKNPDIASFSAKFETKLPKAIAKTLEQFAAEGK